MKNKYFVVGVSFPTLEELRDFAETISNGCLWLYQADVFDPEFSGVVPANSYVLRKYRNNGKDPSWRIEYRKDLPEKARKSKRPHTIRIAFDRYEDVEDFAERVSNGTLVPRPANSQDTEFRNRAPKNSFVLTAVSNNDLTVV